MHIFSNKRTVNGILTESYMVYVFFLIAGILTNYFFKYQIKIEGIEFFGLFLMVFGTFLAIWAQNASKKFKQKRALRQIDYYDFMYGPYKYMRSPTHLGIFVTAMGYAFISKSVINVVFVFLAFLVTSLFFIPCQQRILKKKYSVAYDQYLKKVIF